MKKSFSISIRALRVNPARTLLSTLGIVVGIASLLAILSLGDALEQFARVQIVNTTDVQTIAVNARTSDTIDGIVVSRTDPVLLTQEFSNALSEELGARASVSAFVMTSRLFANPAATARHASLVTAALPQAVGGSMPTIVSGRFINEADIVQDNHVIVISQRLAAKVAGTEASESILEQPLLVDDMPYRIVGVMKQAEGDSLSRAFIPLTNASAQRTFARHGRTPTVLVKVHQLDDVDSVKSAVERFCEHRFASGREEVTVSASIVRLRQVQKLMFMFKLSMGFISGISLIVGGIGIMNILLAAVSERTREIGIRRSCGATKRDVLMQFLAEAVIITGFGGVVGIFTGTLVSLGVIEIIRAAVGMPLSPVFSANPIAISFGAALLVGILFGMYPAVRAGRLSPTDAIRYE